MPSVTVPRESRPACAKHPLSHGNLDCSGGVSSTSPFVIRTTTLLQEYIYFFTVILVAIQEIEGFGEKCKVQELSLSLSLPLSPSFSLSF